MKRNILKVFFLSVSLLLLPAHTYANETVYNRDFILDFLKEAFHAQVALSEKDRSLEEVNALLSPYFTKDYINLFLEENLVEDNGKYFTHGTDFALYYIPFFHFSPKTKIVSKDNEIYVFEFFPGNNEGPVSYESHYEGVLLKEVNGDLKVVEYLFTVPDEIIKLEKTPKKGTSLGKAESQSLPQFLFTRFTINYPLDLFSFFK